MLVLASASPRRKELLAQAGYEFLVIPSDIPEVWQPGEDPNTFVTRLAHEKAQFIFEKYRDEQPLKFASREDPLLVLGADTIVVTAEKILGKPRDCEDARRMLRMLSGSIHQVITGVCLISQEQTATAAESTAVTLRALSEEEISAYVDGGEPLDKAGAYAIQGYAARWIPRIEGCYFNVVGLPLARVANMIDGAKLASRQQTAEPSHP
jgi:septum formation protein